MRQVAPLTMGWCLNCHRDPRPYLLREAIYDQKWKAPADQQQRGDALLKAYHINIEHLTDCSRCHR